MTDWLADLLTDCVADRLVDLLATIHVTNPWNKTRFFLNFLENFVHSLFSPLFSLKYAPLLPQCWPTHILEHWDDCNTQINIGEGENHTSVSRYCDEYCSSLTNWLDWLANVLRFILRKGINLMPSWCESRLLRLLMKMTDFSFQIRFVQQMCQDFDSQDFEFIFSTVSAV